MEFRADPMLQRRELWKRGANPMLRAAEQWIHVRLQCSRSEEHWKRRWMHRLRAPEHWNASHATGFVARTKALITRPSTASARAGSMPASARKPLASSAR